MPPGEHSPTSAALLIALPSGASLGGVQTWAARLLNQWAMRGGHAGVLLHRRRGHDAAADLNFHPGVRTYDLTDLPDMDSAAGNAQIYLPRYESALRDLAALAGRVALLPSMMGDCYGLCVRAAAHPDHDARTIGVAHVDIPYEYALLRHYASGLDGLIAVSEETVRGVQRTLPDRAADVHRVPYGVPCDDAPRPAGHAQRTLRIAYVGRLDAGVKRVGVLPLLSQSLASRGVPHELRIAGDGPDRAMLAAHDAPHTKLLGPLDQRGVASLLAWADVLVLPSRAEGLPICALEAMGRGCVPVLVRGVSGAAEITGDGERGVLVDEPCTGGEPALADAFCDAVRSISREQLARTSAAALACAKQRYSIEANASAFAQIIASAFSRPPRRWPESQRWQFSAGIGEHGGSVPPDGPRRMASVLDALSGATVALHGAGRHTAELEQTLLPRIDRIAAIIDDDASRIGGRLFGRPVVSLEQAAALGVTDVVISSWINQDAIVASRGGEYARRGIRVHVLYGAG